MEPVLPSVGSDARCLFNGRNLSLNLGEVGYDGGVLLMTVSDLSLEGGHVYALAGPNGVGKSSLARLLASKTLTGFPKEITTAVVDPLSVVTEQDARETCSEFLLHQVAGRLSAITEQREELEARLDDAPADQVESLAIQLGELCELEEDMRVSSEEQVAHVLDELGFTGAKLSECEVGQLSSGWRYKCLLARALLLRPELLVLDEPSFLDKASMAWMVERTRSVARSGSVVLLISHKEWLLEQLADRVLFVSASKQLESVNCGWAEFKLARQSSVAHANREVAKGKAEEANAASALRTLKAKVTEGEKKWTKAVSAENAARNKRFVKGRSAEAKQKAGRSAAARVKQVGKNKARLDELQLSTKQHQEAPISLTGAEWPERERMVKLQDVSFSYPGESASVLRNLSASIYGRDRIALVGVNGAGKSTLLRLLLGELNPTDGMVHRSSGLRVAYFPQNALQVLVREHGDVTASELVQERGGIAEAVEARMHLGRFGLKGDLALRKICALSAGQRTRLWLALEFLPHLRPSLLVLDEVENLDKEATSALLEGLAAAASLAVLIVSHDAEHERLFRPRQVWTLTDGQLTTELTEHIQ